MPSQAQRRAKAKGKAKAAPKASPKAINRQNIEAYARQLYEQPQKTYARSVMQMAAASDVAQTRYCWTTSSSAAGWETGMK